MLNYYLRIDGKTNRQTDKQIDEQTADRRRFFFKFSALAPAFKKERARWYTNRSREGKTERDDMKREKERVNDRIQKWKKERTR